jgi:hypothetical protein
MDVKEEARELVLGIFGPSSADKVSQLDDKVPKAFLDEVKSMIASVLGDAIAQQKLAPLYDKYVQKKQ